MSVALLWIVPPNKEASNSLCFLDSIRDGNRCVDSPWFFPGDQNSMFNGRPKKGGRQKRCNSGSSGADLRYSCLGGSGMESRTNFPIFSSMVVNPTGEMVVSSEQKVYDVVLKQAALVKKQLRSSGELDVKPDIVLPGTPSLLSEAYDRCGEVCAEYAKTFYLG